jgi:hypothetical protein
MEIKPGQEVRLNPHPLEYSPGVYLPDYDSPFHGPWDEMSNDQIEDLAFFGQQEVYGPLHDMSLPDWETAQELAKTRQELSEIEADANAIVRVAEMGEYVPTGVFADPPFKPMDFSTPPIEPKLSEAIAEGGEMGMLAKKEVKKRQRKAKEQAPRQYSEMLVVVNDLQLLRQADDEAVGAFMSWLKANGSKVTHFVANGDIADFEAQSGFSKDPDQMGGEIASDEIEAMKWFVETVSTYLPDAEKVFVYGNHSQRFFNMMKDRTDGIEHWIRRPEEMFGLDEHGWKVIPYGMNQFYKWHDRIFWHGHRAGAKSDIAKLELQDTGLISVTTAHVNRNMYHEERDANGRLASGITHGGFSKDSLGFMKKANTGWSQGFGIYYWDKKVGEQPYSVIMKHGSPMFLDPMGVIYDGRGYNLRQEIGLDPKPVRGRRAK